VVNLRRALDEIRKADIWLAGLDNSASQPIFDADLTPPLTLVVGSEGSGLRRLTQEGCDFLVSLPMRGRVQSLNASVSGSIALYEVMRQRTAGRMGNLRVESGEHG